MTEFWNDQDQIWEKGIKQYYTYDNSLRETSYTFSHWDDQKNDWITNIDRITQYFSGYSEEKKNSYHHETGELASYSITHREVETNRVIYDESYNQEAGMFLYWFRTNTHYALNGSSLSVLEVYNPGSGLWEVWSVDELIIQQDQNGCDTLWLFISNDTPVHRRLMHYDEVCRETLLNFQHWNDTLNIWLDNERVETTYQDGIKTSFYYIWDSESQSMWLSTIIEKTIDEVSWENVYLFTKEKETRIRNEFDEFGNQMFQKIETRKADDTIWHLDLMYDSEWISFDQPTRVIISRNYIDSLSDWESFREIIYSYNEKNDLIRDDRYWYSIDTFGKITTGNSYASYENKYYCNDLNRQTISFQGEKKQNRTRFHYHFPSNCSHPQPAPIKVYPNPTKGKITIQSDLITGRDMHFLLTNPLGEEIMGVDIEHLIDFVELDLTSLPHGLYYIFISQKDQKKKEVGSVLKL